MSCLTKSEQSTWKGLPPASCSALKSSKWPMDAVLCSPGLCPGQILDTIQSQEGPVKKQKLRWRCLGWLQTNAGLCTSVRPSNHYRGDCHRCCIFPFAKPSFLLERPGMELGHSADAAFWEVDEEFWGLRRQSPSSQEGNFFVTTADLPCFPPGMGRSCWADFCLSWVVKSRVGIILNHLNCLSRFVQNPDIRFFGVKISQSPPGSQG